MMRDDAWLEEKLFQLWEDHFNDIPRTNPVLIKFGKRSKRQLGAIGWLQNHTQKTRKLLGHSGAADDPRITLINITGFFKDETIPEFVILSTIGHELCHYAHGFNSPLEQRYDHPHKGGVITKEMKARGLDKMRKDAKKWLKENWRNYLSLNSPAVSRRRTRYLSAMFAGW
jgi:hypothetical protein